MLRQQSFAAAGIAAVFLNLATLGTAAALPLAPGYAVTAIVVPGPTAGDVLAVGGALFVGTGSFGAGAQSVLRIDSGGATLLASGFNSLAGFAYDPVADRLIVGDNGGNLPGAVTGDTVYEISAPFGSPTSPASAVDLELLPAGSLPGVADPLLNPSDPLGTTLFISDASEAFPPNGRLLEVNTATLSTSVLQSGPRFAAGLASDGGTLYFGEALLNFTGQVSSLPLADPSLPPSLLVGGLAGQFDLEWSSEGSLLATAGSTLVRIDVTTGNVVTVATGFGFAAGLAEAAGVIYVLDGFPSAGEANNVWALTPLPEPGVALGLGLAGLALVTATRSRRDSSEV